MSICTKPNIPQEYKQRTLSKLRRSLKRFKTARTSKRQDLYYSRLFNQNLPIEVVQLIGSWLPAWDYLKLRRANRYFSQLDKIPCLRYCAYIETEERLKKSYQLITEYRIKLSSESMTCDSLAYIAEACHAKEFVRILNTIEISQQHARSLFISVIDDDWFG